MNRLSIRTARLVCLLAVLAAPSTLIAQDPPAAAPSAAEAGDADATPTPADQAAAEDEPITTGEAFFQKLRQGGITMIFLALLSVFGLAYTFERFARLRRGNVVPRGLAADADRLWRQGQFDQLRQQADQSRSTLGQMLIEIVDHRNRDAATVSSLAGDVASRDLKRHLQRAYPLAVVATLAPLLGLLGTIIGMIEAFDTVAAAGEMGDVSLLGSSIAKALITTGIGLAIAVPALALYHYFKARTNLFGVMLEEEVSQLLSDWYHKPADADDARIQAGARRQDQPDTAAVHAGA